MSPCRDAKINFYQIFSKAKHASQVGEDLAAMRADLAEVQRQSALAEGAAVALEASLRQQIGELQASVSSGTDEGPLQSMEHEFDPVF